MLVKIFHAKYCPANWQTALQEHFFQSLGVSHPPHPPNSYAPGYTVGVLCSSVVNWIIMLSNRECISVVFLDFVRDLYE